MPTGMGNGASWLLQNWSWLAGLGVLILLTAVWLWGPRWQLGRAALLGLSPKEQCDLEDRYRKTIGQALGGLLLLFGTLLTYLEITTSREEAQSRRDTDLYARATEQLGSESRAVRLGGIYALEQVMRSSEGFKPPILEALSAYARACSPRSPRRGEQSKAVRAEERGGYERTGSGLAGTCDPIDTLTAIRVLARNTDIYDVGLVDLSAIDLRGVDLSHLKLEQFLLIAADLSGANLSGAKLTHARLSLANLSNADLGLTNLYRASLDGAKLRGTDLHEAILREANLSGANLSGADLREAKLSDANLKNANLSGADLRGAAVSQEQLESACGDGETLLPDGLTIRLCPENEGQD